MLAVEDLPTQGHGEPFDGVPRVTERALLRTELGRALREPRGEPGGGALVGLRQPRGVDAQCRDSSAAVAEAPGDGAHVDAGGDQLGGGVVAQAVEVGVDAEAARVRP